MNNREMARLERDLLGETLFWRGDCLLVIPAAGAKSQALVAVTADGVHLFQKRTLGVTHDLMGADALAGVSQGVSVNDGDASLPALMFQYNGRGMLLIPVPGSQESVDGLERALSSAMNGVDR
jgi:hypothetical protein